MCAVRILVDHSGYDLLNIGDVAMLQSCVARLRRHWPDAAISVITHAPERLAGYCPGTTAIGKTLADQPLFRRLPRKPRLLTEQAWKITAPYLSGWAGAGRRPARQPRTAVQAVRAADLVVASGGGYITDTWWWHGAGVLSLLSLAQRMGRPTAMFGQGIGPIRMPALRAQASSVLPELGVLGLREGTMGPDLVLALGADPAAVTVTGDDALELAGTGAKADGDALGVNMRVAGYAGVSPAVAASVGGIVLEAAGDLRAPIMALPVSRYAGDADLGAIRHMTGARRYRADVSLTDLQTPGSLVAAAGRCRAIVTGSYHAAVFGLAQGVPSVCLTGSAYYDAKFAGLAGLFPTACSIVSLAQPDFAPRLRAAIEQAWDLPAAGRSAAAGTAGQLRDAGRLAYRRFADRVAGRPLGTAEDRSMTAPGGGAVIA
jgi:colanic acid/amylovoran biosynthesis protein